MEQFPRAKAEALIAEGRAITLEPVAVSTPQWDLSGIPTEVLRAELARREAR